MDRYRRDRRVRKLKEKCFECGTKLNEDDVVWVNPVTTKATMTGNPYCVGCAPEEEDYEW